MMATEYLLVLPHTQEEWATVPLPSEGFGKASGLKHPDVSSSNLLPSFKVHMPICGGDITKGKEVDLPPRKLGKHMQWVS